MKTVPTSMERAKKRVARLKKFYNHLSIYIIVNILLFGIKAYFMDFFDGSSTEHINLSKWIVWNMISTPVIWGIFLAIHAAKVFSHPLVNKWEERQIQKYIEREEKDIPKF
jgi:hypothetical protein